MGRNHLEEFRGLGLKNDTETSFTVETIEKLKELGFEMDDDTESK
ncbi:hypothetical protein QEJ31_10675 [Pigmentibacter sp. JX0631]|nr:hypothetical protein [Pigmentibacter sp. JX0631]WGL58983.1 hypothetical protein QEJ31_10675 [Pigmentibacter sp. JX0631]